MNEIAELREVLIEGLVTAAWRIKRAIGAQSLWLDMQAEDEILRVQFYDDRDDLIEEYLLTRDDLPAVDALVADAQARWAA